jgi:two-component system phosphate regulon sensor histidine kinase PhoR
MTSLVGSLRRRIAVKLTLTLVGFVALVSLTAGLYLNEALQSFAMAALERQLVTAARLLEPGARTLVVRAAPPAELHAYARTTAQPAGSRVTLIAPDGRVLADSEVPPDRLDTIENHASRPEVSAALAGRPGRDIRTSATVHQSYFYVGVPVHDGPRLVAVVRLALPLSVVTASHEAILRMLLAGGVLALVLAVAIGVFVSRRITRPVVEMERIARRMSEGDFAARAPVRSQDEIGMLARALNVVAARMREKIDDLEHEHAKTTAILDAMIEGVIAVDGHDEVVLVNEPARAMLAVPQGTGERKPLLEVVRNADVHRAVRLARGRVDRSALRRHVTVRMGTRVRSIEVNAMPLRLGAGPLGVVMVLHDVTALERLERMRTEFVANVSHELRTPLTAIHGYVETLLAGAIDDPRDSRRFLDVIQRHTERLGRLLNDLTDLSNIELARVALHFAPTSVAAVADAVIEVVRPRAAAKQIGLEVDVPVDLPLVHADHDRLQQILINLLDNAVKYTDAGGRVAVRARTVDGSVEVAVIDTGLGIPAADLPRVTERFYRVDKARSRDLGGTGLGLAIVKHLVHVHGGELRIDSEPGRGTTVVVRLVTPDASQ